MSVVQLNRGWDAQELTALQKEATSLLPGIKSSWREAALAEFLKQGFPTRKTEDWKYTSLAKLQESKYSLGQPDSFQEPLDESTLKNAYRIVIANGRLVKTLSDLASLPEQVLVSDLQEIDTHSELLALLQFDPQYDTALSQLNAALMTNGVLIYIPENVMLEKPLHLIYQTNVQTSQMFHLRNLILLDKNSQCTVVEEYCGKGENYFNNVATHVVVKEQAMISTVKIQNEALGAQHISNTVYSQHCDSTVNSMVISLGAQLNRDNLNFGFNAEGANASLYGLYLPSQGQHIDHHTRVEHAVPHCFSQQEYKGIVGAKAHAVFNGKVMVHKNAQKTSAYQQNKNLLLASSAEVDTKPELEIYADDVKCSHGATVGQLDKKALFYLRSRGIPDGLARQLLTRAFAEGILTALSSSTVVDYVQLKLEDKLNKM